jgi:CHAT domain-containing protein
MIESKLFSGVVQDPHPDIVRAAAEMSLNGKGLAFDAMAAQQSAAICAEEPLLDSLLTEHKNVANRIASKVLSSRGGLDDLLDSMFAEKIKLEEEISEVCSELDLTRNEERFKATDVFGALPDNSIFLDFVTYESYDYEEYYPYPHDSMYAVVAYTSDGQLSIVDIGKMAAIDSLVTEYQSVMAAATESFVLGEGKRSWEKYKRVAAVLYDRLIAPVSDLLENREQVFVAPDGMINLLPFETLTRYGQRFLIEDHQFTYLTSGRDLFKQQSEYGAYNVIVMADPDFMTDPSSLPLLASQETSDIFAFRGNSDSPECLTIMFSPLPKTDEEGTSVVGLFEQSGIYDVSYFNGKDAREGVLKQIQDPPRVLHIASHGYFCDQSDLSNLTNPLLRSGLILAGANSTIGGMCGTDPKTEDGILTALEASGLNLIGTDLVVLSACQTGIGEVQSGEGVFGLRRAFQHAGARSLVTSMFAVPDESTSLLMQRFYENWLSGQSKSSALRNASLSILNERRAENGAAHRLFWGGFILIGDPN